MLRCVVTTEAELIAARIARIRALLADLEKECGTSAEAQEKFRKAKAELDTARASLKTLG